MTKPVAILLACLLGFSAHAQSTAGKTIEGYWQDTARRILFSSSAPPDYKYGQWTALDQQQTYPSAKHIRRSDSGFDVVDLLYDDQESVKVLKASDNNIEFTRTNRWSGCSASHRCGLDGERQLLCSIETKCPQAGGERTVWQGEERYERRASCERTQSRPEAQGIPSVCR
jgi:hypothetical protein